MRLPQKNKSGSVGFTKAVHSGFLALPLITSVLTAQYGNPVIEGVGSGSYASEPVDGETSVWFYEQQYENSPDYEPGKTALEYFLTDRPLYVHDSKDGEPVPTTDWWTDLIFSKYAGNLWAYPFTVSADANGLNVYLPQDFSGGNDGGEAVLGLPLKVSGLVQPSLQPGDTLISDFEGGTFGTNWTATGTAFGSAPSNGTLTGQSVVSGFLGDSLANSFHGGDASTGELASPTFTIDGDYIHALVGGGNHPGIAEVQLIVGGSVVRSATGVNSEALSWNTWDVTEFDGQTGQIKIVDNATGGWGHILADLIVMTDLASSGEVAARFGDNFSPVDAVALDWSDWVVQMRLEQDALRYMDVTIGHGLPYVWIETVDAIEMTVDAGPAPIFKDTFGNVVSLPYSGSVLSVEYDGKTYGLHVPDGTTFAESDSKITITHSGTSEFLVISALPDASQLSYFDTYAYAIPRDTQMNWSYDPNDGFVRSNWSIAADALKGSNLTVQQGWIPHHYRETDHNLSFGAVSMQTIRGKMKFTTSNTAQIDFPFTGILPGFPEPKALGLADDFSLARMEEYLGRQAERGLFSGATYWIGKGHQQFSDQLLMADILGSEHKEEIQSKLKENLIDWFTFEPSEENEYFAYYDRYKALVAFDDSDFGSSFFTDHHFHYGYFTRAGAILGMLDPEFLDEYGPMLELIAREYANWDRPDTTVPSSPNDPLLPFMRSFDPWVGHSYAGGIGDPYSGNNQESSSEAMMSWAGVFLLGEVMENPQMRAAGAMGYAMERLATKEYWFDYHGSDNATNPIPGDGPTQPSTYTMAIAPRVYNNSYAEGTFFSAAPYAEYGINWLPFHAGSTYLGEDAGFAEKQFGELLADQHDHFRTEFPIAIDIELNQARAIYNDLPNYSGNELAAKFNEFLGEISKAVQKAYDLAPNYLSNPVSTNPFYDNGSLSFTVTDKGVTGLDLTVWNQLEVSTNPDLTPPAELDGGGQLIPIESWPVYQFLSTDLVVEESHFESLYEIDLANYQEGVDANDAAVVLNRIGYPPTMMGYVSLFNPDITIDAMDIHYAEGYPTDAAEETGIIYYSAHSLRSLGHVSYDRYTSIPTSQVFYNASTGVHSYVVHNISDVERVATVYEYDGGNSPTVIGSFPVPANTMVQHELDQTLTSLEIDASDPSNTITTGSSVQFSVAGFDQYGGSSALSNVTWSVSAGGNIDANGLFTATANADPVVVTVTGDSLDETYTFRVGEAPYLAELNLNPEHARVVQNDSFTFSASGFDQYGDSFALGNLIWSTSGGGAIDNSGVFTSDGTLGSYYVIADENGFAQTSIATVHAPLSDIATGKPVTSSSELIPNTDDLVNDGDGSTRWESTHGSDTEWIYIDLGSVHNIERVFIDWEPAYASEYKIQLSDDALSWTTALTVEKNNFEDDDLAVEGTGRYVRMLGVARGSGYGYSIWEMEVYGSLASESITASSMLINPPGVDLMLGSVTDFNAFVFDASLNGGPTTNVSWSATGGQIDSDGLYTADSIGGPFVITASYLGATTGATLEETVTVNVLGGVLTNIAPLGTASASSEESVGVAAAAAIDADLNTRWSSAFNDNEQITVDLGEVETIESVTLRWEGAYASAYEIQVSTDGVSWSTVITENLGDGGEDAHVIATDARYVRMQGVTRATIYGYSLWEFEIYAFAEGATPPTPAINLAEGQSGMASSVEGVFVADSAFDGDAGTRWSSAFSDDEWVYVDLGSVQSVSQVVLTWEGAYGLHYKIQVSDDASTWTDAIEITNGDGGEDDLAISASGRYVRMLGIDRGTPWGYSLFEFEVY